MLTTLSARIAFLGIAAALIFGAGWYASARVVAGACKAKIERLKADAAAQEALAEQIERDNQALKEMTDAHYQAALASVRADAGRVRGIAAAAVYVPAASPGSADPDRACFNRAELDAALRVFASGAAGLAAEGDEAVTGLDAAKRWASALDR